MKSASDESSIEVSHEPDDRRVDVTVDGDPFTSYLYDTDMEYMAKPVCYPVRTASGTPVTRGYPLDPRPRERYDHPHHVGFWLNYGEVNGVDFWNNTGDGGEGLGHIRPVSVDRAADGDVGELVTTSEWIGPDGTCHLREETTYAFRAGDDERVIDRATTLTAERDVEMHDDKEGMLAIRVRRELDHPTEGTTSLLGEDGRPMAEPVPDSEAVVGEYVSGAGIRGTNVWGTRAHWVALTGAVDDEPITLTIMDHPDNVGHPTYWHARPYGLFAANPLGRDVFTDGTEELDFELEAGESTTFRHRLDVLSAEFDEDRIEDRYAAFVDEAR